MHQVSQSKAPALFVGHGNPMNAIGDNLFVASLNNLGKNLQKPKAVLVISAHWSAPYSALSLHESELLYDMYGFPKELCINTKLSMREHFELGKALEALRDEGVMILGSGNVTHNLAEAVLGDKDALIDFEERERYARRAHPTIEHFIPLLYIAGASASDEKSRFVYEGIEHGNLSMRSWITGVQNG